MKSLLYLLFTLTALNLNVAHAQKSLVWSELCQGYGSGFPLVVVDGVPIHPDSILSPVNAAEGITIKNGSKPFTIRPEDIEKVDVLNWQQERSATTQTGARSLLRPKKPVIITTKHTPKEKNRQARKSTSKTIKR